MECLYARFPVTYMAMHEMTINFSDMNPLVCTRDDCTNPPLTVTHPPHLLPLSPPTISFGQAVFDCTIDGVGINTGNLDKYIELSVKQQLKAEGYHNKDITKDWQTLAEHHGWVTNKKQLYTAH